MQNSLFLVFVGALICQVYGQRLPPPPAPSQPACACSVVDDCVQKETVMKTTCQKDCLAKLNDKAQVCVKSRHDALSKAFTDGNACIEKALGRPCTPATRARRSPSTPAHSAVFHGGMGPAKITILTGAAPKTEFAAFNTCFLECIHKDDPKPANPQGPGNNQRREWATTNSGQGGQGESGPVVTVTPRGTPIEHIDVSTTNGPFGGHPAGPSRHHAGGPHGGPGGHGGPPHNMFYQGCDGRNKCSLARLDWTKNPTDAAACKKTAAETFAPIEPAYCKCLQDAYSTDAVTCKSPPTPAEQ
jgi:hypothetical protein